MSKEKAPRGTTSTDLIASVNSLSSAEFEMLCAKVLESMGFRDIFPRKSGSQSGRDLDAFLRPGNEPPEPWYFECKHYTSGPVPFNEIINKVYLIQHLSPKPSALVLICSAPLANDVHDFLNQFAEDLDFPILRITDEKPEHRFRDWIYAYKDAVNEYLESIGKKSVTSVPEPHFSDYLSILQDEKEKYTRPAVRLERALRLNAYPRLTISSTGRSQKGGGSIKNTLRYNLTIKNVGHGLAKNCRLTILLDGEFQTERIVDVVAANEEMEVAMPVFELPDVKDVQQVKCVLTYQNALKHYFLVTYQIGMWENPKLKFKDPPPLTADEP